MCDDCTWEEAVETADEILETLEELPEAAEEFAISVDEKTSSIRAWIAENRHVTKNQISALDNMRRGAEKWLPD